MLVYSTKGLRSNNEDTYSILKKNKILFCGIYDGHGGDEVSKFLKNNLGKLILKEPKCFNINIIKKIFSKFSKRLNKYLLRYKINSGSTALITMMQENKLIIINIGDCRGIICRKGLAIPLTKDHKPGFIEEKERIVKMGGKLIYDKAIKAHRIQGMSVSRSFGDLDVKYVSDQPDIYKYKVNKDDNFVLLASDGLWDSLSNQDVVEFILNNINKKNSLKNLAKLAIENGSKDNITIILIKL